MKTLKCNFIFILSSFFSIILCSCGGGGKSTTPTGTIPPAGGFVATADNKMKVVKKIFALGQTATFNSVGVSNETWSSANGG